MAASALDGETENARWITVKLVSLVKHFFFFFEREREKRGGQPSHMHSIHLGTSMIRKRKK